MPSAMALRVPRLADAEAVHLVDLHVRDHLRRRNGDERDILVGMDAAARQPVAHPHRVRAGRKRHRERQRIAGGFGAIGQRLHVFWALHARLLQLVVQRDRLPVAIQQPGNHHRLHRRSRQPHRRGERHADQHVRALVLAEIHLVADDRPRRFLRDDRVDAEFLEVPELVRDDDRRAVGERDHAEAHRRSFRASRLRRRCRPSRTAVPPSGRPSPRRRRSSSETLVAMPSAVSSIFSNPRSMVVTMT